MTFSKKNAIFAVLFLILRIMKNTKKEMYTIINPAFLQKLGHNVSSMSELLLFDNLDGECKDIPPSSFFSNNLIKLGSDIIVISLYGELKYMMDCNRPINLRSGEFAYLHEGEIIEFLDADADCKIILLSLPHKIGMINLKDKDVSYYSSVVRPTSQTLDELCSTYRRMKHKMDDPSFTLKEDIVFSYLMVFLSLMYDAMNKTDNASVKSQSGVADRQMELYNEFVRSVKTHYAEHRDVAFYASDICISPGHLGRIVKNISGKTVSEWIKDYVVLEAKVMLRLQKLAIKLL